MTTKTGRRRRREKLLPSCVKKNCLAASPRSSAVNSSCANGSVAFDQTTRCCLKSYLFESYSNMNDNVNKWQRQLSEATGTMMIMMTRTIYTPIVKTCTHTRVIIDFRCHCLSSSHLDLSVVFPPVFFLLLLLLTSNREETSCSMNTEERYLLIK